MIEQSRARVAWIGFAWGCIAAIALVALMYLAALLLGLRPLPQALNQPLLAIMPGFVFGFLIDTLQHAGKVVEEFSLIVAMVVALGVLGAASFVAFLRWRSRYLPLVFAAAGFVVVVALLLPISGSGFLGLDDGPATPIEWAVLFAVYGVVLQMGAEPAGAVDGGRRRILSAVPLSIGAIGLGVLGVRLIPDWYSAVFNPPEAGLSGPSPEITPVQDFYVVSKNFADPVVDGQSWRLHVGGLADHGMTLSLPDLRALSAVNEYVTLECISNDVGGGLISTGAFTGVSLRDLVAMANPRSNASWVSFSARDGYTESLPLTTVNSSPEILVAYDLDGQPLPASHGYPARILIPGHYGMKGPKWLDRIDLVDHETGGYWEQQGWDHNALVRTTSRIDVPGDGQIIKLGAVTISGVAYAGKRGVSKVEYSTDGGSSWNPAALTSPLSPYSWVLWSASWAPASEGAYRLVVRAVDGSGSVQPSSGAASFPSGAAGYHSVHVDVSK